MEELHDSAIPGPASRSQSQTAIIGLQLYLRGVDFSMLPGPSQLQCAHPLIPLILIVRSSASFPSSLFARHCSTCAINSSCVLTARESGRIVLAPEVLRGENR
jgi:hypothetical protein